MPSISVTHFKTSQAYRSGSASLRGPLTQMSKVSGVNNCYIGHETEDPSILFWVNDWDTKDAHDAFIGSAECANVMAASRLAIASEPTVNHVVFEDPRGALGAPITEFVTFTLKEGRTVGQLEPLVRELHQKLVGTPRFHGDSWAPITGKPNVYHGILGWDTVQAHWDAVSDGPLKEVIDRVKLVADLWLVHAALRPFSA